MNVFFPVLCLVILMGGRQLSGYAQMNPAAADSVRVNELLKQASSLMFSAPDSAKILINTAFSLSKTLGNDALIAASLMSQGRLFSKENKRAEELRTYQTALDYAERAGNWRLIAGCRGNIGLIFQENGEYQQAQGIFGEVIQTFEAHQDTGGMARGYLAMSGVLEQRKRPDSALLYFKKALQMLEHQQMLDEGLIAESYYSMGNLYTRMDSTEKAMGCFLRALQTNRRIGHLHGQVAAYAALIEGCISRKEYSKAHGYINDALAIANASQFLYGQADLALKQGQVYCLEKNYQAALNGAALAETFLNTLKDEDMQKAVYVLFADCYAGLGQKAKAKKYREMSEEFGRK